MTRNYKAENERRKLYRKYPWLLDLPYQQRIRACEYCWFFEGLGRQPPQQMIKEKFNKMDNHGNNDTVRHVPEAD